MSRGTPLPGCARRADVQSSHAGLGFLNTELNATHIIALT